MAAYRMGRQRRRQVILAAVGVAAWCGLAASQTSPGVLPDGSPLKGVEGRLSKSGDRWLFELGTAVRQGPTLLDRGPTLEVLPSAVLEALVAGPPDRVRLSGQVQTYRGRNYVFVTSFAPLAAADANTAPLPPPGPARDPNQASGPPPGGKADPLAIPESIQKKLAAYQATRQRSAKPAPVAAAIPQVVVDEVGLIVHGQERTFFVTDSLGQNAMPRVFDLLPCGTLESMEHVQSQAAEPVRFRVAGLVTEYQGRSCLLLHRAVREHDYGNFGR
jgi:hypothetical protein